MTTESRAPRAGRRDRDVAVLAAIALLALAAACRRGAEPRAGAGAETRTAPAIVVVATGAEPSGVNELIDASSRRIDQDVSWALFLHLLRERPDFQQHPATFAPQLARAWEIAPDRKTITFHLRDDVRWSDGVPVTADDVRFTWLAQTSKEVGWPSSAQKEAIADVEVVDPHTVRFHFSKVDPTQLADANDGVILPAHVWSKLPFSQWQQSGDWFRTHLVVDGPFTVESWKTQQEIVLRRNERYFEAGKPGLDRVVFRIVPDEAARLQELIAGAAQVVEFVPPDRADEVARTPGRRILPVWTRQYTAIAWNTRRPPLDSAEVRRALTLALDRQGLVDALYRGHAKVADSPLLSSVWAHPPDLHPLPYDPAQAKRLLAAHGFRDTDADGLLEWNGKPFALELSTNSGNQLRHDALVLIQEQLRRVGIVVTPVFREGGTQAAKLDAHDFQGALLGWGIDTSLDLRTFDGRDPDGSNWGGYRNAEVDRLLDRIDAEPDRLAARPLFAQVEHLIADDQPYTFLWEPQTLVGLDARIEGAQPNALSTFYALEDWRLRPPR